MKTTLKTFFCLMAAAVLLTSCLGDDETYRAGFSIEKPGKAINYYYANNISDSLVFWSYGSWTIVDYQGYDNSWFTMPVRNGKGNTVYEKLMTFTQNTTGKARVACFVLQDESHPGDAYSSMAFWQYATRGDGSLGTAADVKSITGSDGSAIDLTYDRFHRATSVKIQKEGQTLSNLQLVYDDDTKKLSVTDNGGVLTSSYDKDYQPGLLLNGSDTVGYFARYYSNYVTISPNYTFNFKHLGSKANTCVTYNFGYYGCSLEPDSLHNVDSLTYYKDNFNVPYMKLGFTYSDVDNRHQTVDANQLLLGVEKCDPYLLVSLFRYARNSKVISKAKHEDVEIDVETSLNSDKSIHTLTVKRGADTIVYTFNY